MGRKMTLWWGVADAWGQMAAGKAGRRTGVSDTLGWLVGPGAAARLGQGCLRLRGPTKPGQQAGLAGGRR